MTNPARRGASARLAEIDCLAAVDKRDSTDLRPVLQALFIVRRIGLSPVRARLVAELCFDGRRE